MKRTLVLAVVCLALTGCEGSEAFLAAVAPTVIAAGSAATVTPAEPVEVGTPEAPATATAAPTATATAEPTATPTPLPLSPAPRLVGPPDGETVLRGTPLSWEADRPLGEDEYYVVLVTFAHGKETWRDGAWLTGSSWAVPNYFGLPHSVDGWYEWKVVVMRQTGVGEDGRPVGQALSAESESRRFLCYGE